MKSYKAIIRRVIEQSYAWNGENGIAVRGGWESHDGSMAIMFERWDIRVTDARRIELWLDNSLDEELDLGELAFLIPTPVYSLN